MIKLPPQLKNQYDQLVETEQRLRSFTAQKSQWEMQKASIENSIAELETAKQTNPDTPIYKNAGAILIKVNSIDKILEELKEKNELLDMRMKTVTKQIERISEQYESMKDKFQKAIQQMSQSPDFQPM